MDHNSSIPSSTTLLGMMIMNNNLADGFYWIYDFDGTINGPYKTMAQASAERLDPAKDSVFKVAGGLVVQDYT